MKRQYSVALLLLSLLLLSQTSLAQEKRNRVFKLGGTVGFSANLPVINSIDIEGLAVDNIRTQYKVGYLASLFFRINIERFFLQPSFSWVHGENEIHFSTPVIDANGVPVDGKWLNHQVNMEHRSLEVPILVGYNVVKEGPYGLSVMAGPKLKYSYKSDYLSQSSGTTTQFISDNTPYGISIATGVGVTIWRLFFDFVYEFGLNQVESDFKSKYNREAIPENTVSFDRRINVMSFSLGFLF